VNKLKLTPTASIDHTPHVHPVSPTQKLPADFSSSAPKSASSFTSYRQQAQQHGPLGRNTKAEDGIGNHSGHSLGAVEASKGEYFDRNELPQRFRRSRIELSEIDAIETGGATLVC
jgi:small subunit ribosomal protein YMR-31